jgi:hypothetical protein
MVKTCLFVDLINPFISIPNSTNIAHFLKNRGYKKFILEEKFRPFHTSPGILSVPYPMISTGVCINDTVYPVS